MPDSEQEKGIEEEQVEDLDETKPEGESEDDVEGHAFDAFQKVNQAQKVQPISKPQENLSLNYTKIKFD